MAVVASQIPNIAINDIYIYICIYIYFSTSPDEWYKVGMWIKITQYDMESIYLSVADWLWTDKNITGEHNIKPDYNIYIAMWHWSVMSQKVFVVGYHGRKFFLTIQTNHPCLLQLLMFFQAKPQPTIPKREHSGISIWQCMWAIPALVFQT